MQTDTDMLDWLERNGHVNFDYENAIVSFKVPAAFTGADSIREILSASMVEGEE